MDVGTRYSGRSLQVRLWTDDEFAGSKAVWGELLKASDADPLFMSWDWQWRWWKHHQRSLRAELRLVAVYSDACLVGLAPFYAHKSVVRAVLPVRRMELIGTAWRDSRAAFSDYLDVVAMREFRAPVISHLVGWLRGATWDELVFCGTRRDGLACEVAAQHLPKIAHVREVDPIAGWCAELPERFEAYVDRLSPHVRRRLFNQRRKLDRPAVQYAQAGDIEGFLALLWQFVADRWQGSYPHMAFRDFYLDVAKSLERDGRLRLSRLDTQSGPLSVMFNALAGNRLYYLQSGFDQERSSGISCGYLHFGYAIEAACAEGVHLFDLLGGTGRHRDYKRDLVTEMVPLVTYHAIRNPWARGLYATYGAWLWAKSLMSSW